MGKCLRVLAPPLLSVLRIPVIQKHQLPHITYSEAFILVNHTLNHTRQSFQNIWLHIFNCNVCNPNKTFCNACELQIFLSPTYTFDFTITDKIFRKNWNNVGSGSCRPPTPSNINPRLHLSTLTACPSLMLLPFLTLLFVAFPPTLLHAFPSDIGVFYPKDMVRVWLFNFSEFYIIQMTPLLWVSDKKISFQDCLFSRDSTRHSILGSFLTTTDSFGRGLLDHTFVTRK